MKGPSSLGNSVIFITASCSHIYHWNITSCNQSQMSGLVLILYHSLRLDTDMSCYIMHLIYCRLPRSVELHERLSCEQITNWNVKFHPAFDRFYYFSFFVITKTT